MGQMVALHGRRGFGEHSPRPMHEHDPPICNAFPNLVFATLEIVLMNKRRLAFLATLTVGSVWVLGIGSCIQSLLFGIAPLLL